MQLDFSLAQPTVTANPLASYAQGQEQQQRNFEMAASRQEYADKRQMALQRQELMKDLLAENSATTNSIVNPLKQAERLEGVVPKLLAINDFQTANTLTNSARELRLNAGEASKEAQRKDLAKFEGSAKAAQASLAMPDDPVLHSEAVNAYLTASGGDPSSMQIVKRATEGTPEERAKAMREISLSALDSTRRAETEVKLAEQLEARKMRDDAKKHDQTETAWYHRQQMALREGAAERQVTREGAVAQRQTKAAIDSGKNLANILDTLAVSPVHTTSMFGLEQAHGGLFSQGLQKYAANTLTDEDYRQFDITLTGFQRDVAVLMTAFGKGTTEAMVKELMPLRIRPNDTLGTAQLVIADGAGVARNALESLDLSSISPEQRGKVEGLLEKFRKIPSMAEVRSRANAKEIDPKATVIPQPSARQANKEAADFLKTLGM